MAKLTLRPIIVGFDVDTDVDVFFSTRDLDIVVKSEEGIMLLALFVPFLMLRLLLASLVIDRMSDWSLHFCGDAATINYQQWSKKYDSCIIHAKYGKLHDEKV